MHCPVIFIIQVMLGLLLLLLSRKKGRGEEEMGGGRGVGGNQIDLEYKWKH